MTVAPKLQPVAEAKAAILKGVKPVSAEAVCLSDAPGRVLAAPVKAKRDQPPFDSSSMDGFAVRAADVARTPCSLQIIGEARAGASFAGTVKAGQATMIYTGAPVPKGSDAVVIQENTTVCDQNVHVGGSVRTGQYIRPRGFDFRKGDTLLAAPVVLSARDIGLAASANQAELKVRRRPVVALIGTGDELVPPGQEPNADQIISSNNAALSALIQRFGATPLDLGIVPDKVDSIARAVDKVRDADVLITIGGASVGKHDLVQQALKKNGIRLNFWRIAMRPGKPLMFAQRGAQRIIGLPGNPVSALVCSRIFLKPLIDRLLGLPDEDPVIQARLTAPLPANDMRQDYLRARLERESTGRYLVSPADRQDSSMQRIMAAASGLIIRPPFAKAARKGSVVDVLPIDF